jgi:replication-associated recombination protein RarA
MSKEFLWVEKYRPSIVEDCILPESIKEVFQGFVNQGELPNLLLSGTAGVGKTTIAKALCEEIGASYIVINGSEEPCEAVCHYGLTDLWSVPQGRYYR